MMNTDFIFLESRRPVALRGFTRRVVVAEFEGVLLYRQGRFLRQLAPGVHRLWGRDLALSRVDLRKATLTLSGQEVLTSDNVGLKLSLALTWQLVDPVKALQEVQDWQASLYQIVQLALRSVVAGVSSETLLGQRTELGSRLLAAAVPGAASLGVSITALDVKDFMYPGEMKRLFTEVLKAKLEGLAALERARGESASLRNLANAARLLDGNPALQNLRLLQTLASAGQAGSTFVMGVPAGFVPLAQRPGADCGPTAANQPESGGATS